MKSDTENPACPWCSKPALRVTESHRLRRMGRSLSVEVERWRCASGCEDPDADGVYTFTDAALEAENALRADAAWRGAFGEPLPPHRPPGRPTDEAMDARFQLRLSRGDVRLLDATRGAASRSEFVRALIHAAARSAPLLADGGEQPYQAKPSGDGEPEAP